MLLCCSRPPRGAAPHRCIVEPWPPDDEAPGHSFRFLPRSPTRRSPPPASTSLPSPPPPRGGREDDQPPRLPAFRAISGAAFSANSSSRPVFRRRPADRDESPSSASPAASNPAGFEGSASFAAAPLQLPSSSAAGDPSGPLDRGPFFFSGSIELGALSGPLDGGGAFSGPLVSKFRRNERRKRRAFPGSDSAVLLRATPFFLRRGLLDSSRNRRPWVVPLRGRPQPRVQWAHGKAGEDRVHVVVSEEHRWLFVGIYDGFNGPDAPEFLAAHLYRAVFDQLRGLFWEEDQETQEEATGAIALVEEDENFGGNKGASIAEEPRIRRPLREFLADEEDDGPSTALRSVSDRFVFPLSKLRDGIGSWRKEGRKLHFSHWSYGGEGDEKVTGEATRRGQRKRWRTGAINHGLVLGALSRALESTELAYLEMTDRELGRNPELALMGSCLLVVLMREDDVYVMNVGDSRVIVAQCKAPPKAAEMVEGTEKCGDVLGLVEDIAEVPCRGTEEAEDQEMGEAAMDLMALQLSTDHSTSIQEAYLCSITCLTASMHDETLHEVNRIKEEHPDDSKCIVNNRVKGRLKVTRAFGAGFLKQYLTNEEVVSHVHNFMERFPDGDPAQSLIEELLFRAASEAGKFHM
ncbi:hypothetical protein Taro_026600 [Colocasia esculenta]|uniref:protein-serine/threonine phosphatase n=1 Tax=Colocasia esculenta TaxID=4460 RepID=A0A843V6K4_COLES|nr:hypothetical protein [Colocasia esculenta]